MKNCWLCILMGIFSFNLTGQNAVGANANRYKTKITNTSKYHLHVELVTPKKGIYQVLSPGQTWTINTYNSIKKFKQVKIICRYTDQTYSKDKNILDRQYDGSVSDLALNRQYLDNQAFGDLRNKVIAEGLSNVYIDSDSQVLQFFAMTSRVAGKVTKAFYSFKEVMEDINSRHFSSYEELIEEYLLGKFEDAIVHEVSQLIESELGLKSATSKYIIGATLHYLSKSQDIEKSYQNQLQIVQEMHSKQVEHIRSLKNDPFFSSKYSYNLFSILKKPIDLSTKSPDFVLTIDPLNYGNSINSFVKPKSERVFSDRNNDKELDWEDGLWNRNAGIELGLAVFPELKLSNRSYSRFYINGAFYNSSYTLYEGVSLSRNFFSEIPPNNDGFSITNPITFEQMSTSIKLSWRAYMLGGLFLELDGGYSMQNGRLSLKNSVLSDGFEWANNTIKIVETDFQPFAGLKFGIGANKFNGGYHLSCAVQALHIDYNNDSEYRISETSTNIPVTFSSNGKIVYRINVGMSFGF